MINRTYHLYIEAKPSVYSGRVANGDPVQASTMVHYRSLMPKHDDVMQDSFERLCSHVGVDKSDFMIINFTRIG